MNIQLILLFLGAILCLISAKKDDKPVNSPIVSPSCPFQKKKSVLELPLKIGAWNVQKLGKSKIKNPFVLDILAKVMLRYDIILIQEIVDGTQSVPYQLLEELNKAVNMTMSDLDPKDSSKRRIAADGAYEIALSDRIGRSSSRYREQYAFYYRKDRVTLHTTFQFPDPKDVFQVESFVAVFDTPTAEVGRIALIPIHTSPEDAAAEIDALVDVYDAVVEKFDIKDALILGDFNGGCSYVTRRDWLKIRLRTDDRFDWLISDHEDTTTKRTTCPYDRIVVAGTSLKASIHDKRGTPFYFDEVFHIEDKALVKAVSDHYPVEVLIRNKANSSSEYQQKVEEGLVVEIKSTSSAVNWLKESCLKVKIDDKRKIPGQGEINDKFQTEIAGQFGHSRNNSRGTSKAQRRNRPKEPEDEELVGTNLCGKSPSVIVAESQFLMVHFHPKTIASAVDILDTLALEHGCIFSKQDISVIKHKLKQGVFSAKFVYGEKWTSPDIMLRLFCFIDTCTILITKDSPIIF